MKADIIRCFCTSRHITREYAYKARITCRWGGRIFDHTPLEETLLSWAFLLCKINTFRQFCRSLVYVCLCSYYHHKWYYNGTLSEFAWLRFQVLQIAASFTWRLFATAQITLPTRCITGARFFWTRHCALCHPVYFLQHSVKACAMPLLTSQLVYLGDDELSLCCEQN